MTVRYLLNSVKITPENIKIRKGLKNVILSRSSLVGIERRLLTGKIIFIMPAKRYKVVLWHGFGRIKKELYVNE